MLERGKTEACPGYFSSGADSIFRGVSSKKLLFLVHNTHERKDLIIAKERLVLASAPYVPH